MKPNVKGLTALAVLVVGQSTLWGEEPSQLRQLAGTIRATAAETNYHKIPWVTDLFEGFRLAKEEHRPVFLYMITGDPLADC